MDYQVVGIVLMIASAICFAGILAIWSYVGRISQQLERLNRELLGKKNEKVDGLLTDISSLKKEVELLREQVVPIADMEFEERCQARANNYNQKKRNENV